MTRPTRVAACSRTWLVLAALAGALVLLVATAQPGWSHASLRASTPADGEAVTKAPDTLSFTFNEPVEATTGALRVFDGSGARVDDGVQDHPEPDVVTVGLGDLTDGGYVATFRVTSADGHVIRGATTFQVGSGAALDDQTVAALFGGGDGPIGLVAGLVRAIDLGSTLVAVGALLAAVAARSTARQRSLASQTARVAARTGIVATVLVVPLQAMATSGLGLSALASTVVLGDAITSSVGLAALTRLAGLLVVLATATALVRPGPWSAPRMLAWSGGAVLALGSLLVDGHTRTVEPAWVMLLGDAVHVAAGAIWAGGLVVTARVLRRDRVEVPAAEALAQVGVGPAATAVGRGPGRSPATSERDAAEVADQDPAPATPDTPVDDARFLAWFSGRASWAMLALALAGTAMGWALVRQPRALVSTDHGWVLVAKVAVVVVILVVAAYNRFRLVPAIVAAGPDEAAARRQVGTTVRIEAALLVVVLGLTAVLVNLRPAADEAGISGAFDTVVALTDDVSVNLVIDPNRAGTNQVHVYVLDQTGRPLAEAEDVRLELVQVDQDIGPIERTPLPAGPGHWLLTGPELVVPGTWEITTVIAMDRFTEERATVSVVVNPS